MTVFPHQTQLWWWWSRGDSNPYLLISEGLNPASPASLSLATQRMQGLDDQPLQDGGTPGVTARRAPSAAMIAAATVRRPTEVAPRARAKHATALGV